MLCFICKEEIKDENFIMCGDCLKALIELIAKLFEKYKQE